MSELNNNAWVKAPPYIWDDVCGVRHRLMRTSDASVVASAMDKEFPDFTSGASISVVPTGLKVFGVFRPTNKLVGYFQLSRWDKEYGRFNKKYCSLYYSTPSGSGGCCVMIIPRVSPGAIHI